MAELDSYVIEKRVIYELFLVSETFYRFRSLFNGTVGTWHESKNDAVADGEKHQKLVLSVINALKIRFN